MAKPRQELSSLRHKPSSEQDMFKEKSDGRVSQSVSQARTHIHGSSKDLVVVVPATVLPALCS